VSAVEVIFCLRNLSLDLVILDRCPRRRPAFYTVQLGAPEPDSLVRSAQDGLLKTLLGQGLRFNIILREGKRSLNSFISLDDILNFFKSLDIDLQVLDVELVYL